MVDKGKSCYQLLPFLDKNVINSSLLEKYCKSLYKSVLMWLMVHYHMKNIANHAEKYEIIYIHKEDFCYIKMSESEILYFTKNIILKII